MMPIVVPANESHVEGIYQLQTQCYAEDVLETREEFRAIVHQNTSFVALNQDTVVGYILSHSWHSIAYPPSLHDLDLAGVLPEPADKIHGDDSRCHFIHDLSVSPSYRNSLVGVGKLLFNATMDLIGPSRIVTLVSVNSTVSYWEKRGFVSAKVQPTRILSSYPEAAVYMIRLQSLVVNNNLS
ncbi:acyl-CoA N-acyltransferase [Obelidium mucronatum]|nr:acyl-CoA N-acyltransferase [Obelidium mucronatum]